MNLLTYRQSGAANFFRRSISQVIAVTRVLLQIMFYQLSTKHLPFTIDLRCTDKYWTRRGLPSSPPRLLRRRYYSLSARTLRLRTMTPCRLIHGTTLYPDKLSINALQRTPMCGPKANSAKFKVKLDSYEKYTSHGTDSSWLLMVESASLLRFTIIL